MTDMSCSFTAVVTGASSGIGEATCEAMLGEGGYVIGIDKSPATIVSHSYRHCQCDVSDWDSVHRLLASVGDRISIDYLILCAGVFYCENRSNVKELEPSEVSAVLDVNLVGAMNVVRECLPLMHGRERDRAIAFVSSDQVVHPRAKNGAYAASKGALEAFARTCSAELKSEGIRVNIVEAASVRTRFIERLSGGGELMEEMYRREERKMPFGLIYPEDVAKSLLFLCSEQSKKITGQTLLIDSGRYE